eukprot:m.79998 g.79998  ORF g.79998 m.79998 type:complete len:141 (+) comp25271_c0_seq1:158-580(+)
MSAPPTPLPVLVESNKPPQVTPEDGIRDLDAIVLEVETIFDTLKDIKVTNGNITVESTIVQCRKRCTQFLDGLRQTLSAIEARALSQHLDTSTAADVEALRRKRDGLKKQCEEREEFLKASRSQVRSLVHDINVLLLFEN